MTSGRDPAPSRAKREVTLGPADALHVRPASVLAQEAGKFQSRITVRVPSREADARSVLGLLSLGAEPGTKLLIEAEGPDAQEAVEAVCALVERGFRGEQ